MNIEKKIYNGEIVASVTGADVIIKDTNSALDLIKDFIYEANCGKDFFFVSSLEEALERLTK